MTRRLLPWCAPALATLVMLTVWWRVAPKRPFWFDELNTVLIVRDHSLRHMIHAVVECETLPPFYHLVLWPWAQLGGTGETWLRFPTVAGVIGAIIITWCLIRRALGAWPAAVATLGAFLLHQHLLDHAVEARYHGVLIFLVAAAVALGEAVRRRCDRGQRPGWPLLLLVTLTHGALCLTHPYGPMYSLMLLASQLARDWRRWRGRLRGYLAVMVGWLFYLPWVPVVVYQARYSQPRSFMPTPTFAYLIEIISPGAEIIALAAVLILLWLTPRPTPPASEPEESPATSQRLAIRSLVWAAAGLLAVGPLAGVMSRIVTPILNPRYMLPQIIAWATLLALVVWMTMGQPAQSASPSRAAKVIMVILAALALARPIEWALPYAPFNPHGAHDQALWDNPRTRNLTLVLESAEAYLARWYYFPEYRNRTAFLLDLDAALRSDDPAATTYYKEMKALKQSYPDLHVEELSAFAAHAEAFLVLEGPSQHWDDRDLQRLGHFRSTPAGWIEGQQLWLVERVR